MAKRFEVLSVRPAPDGFDALGLVNLIFRPSEGEPVRITRYSKAKKRSYDAGMITGTNLCIRLDDVPVNEGDRGPWLAQGNIELPRDVADAVAMAAAKMLETGEVPADETPEFPAEQAKPKPYGANSPGATAQRR